MATREEIACWEAYAKREGLSRASSPMDWLATRVTGMTFPPFVFWPPWVVGLLQTIYMGVSFGIVTWYLNSGHRPPPEDHILMSAIFGLLFGVVVGLSHWFRRGRLGLTSWKAFLSAHGKPG